MADELIPNPSGTPPVATPPVATPPVATPPVATPPVATPPVVAAPEPKPIDSVTGADGKVTFNPTGDAGLDLALKFFGGLGLGPDAPELVEASKGNFSYLEAKLKTLGDKAKGSEEYLEVAKSAHARLEGAHKAAYEARQKTVHEAVGGEEAWKQVEAFVVANADPAELTEVKAALSQGGIAAKAVAQMLHAQMLAHPGTSTDGRNPAPHQATPPQGATLTLSSYRVELNALAEKLGGSHRLDDSPEYTALKRKYAGVNQ